MVLLSTAVLMGNSLVNLIQCMHDLILITCIFYIVIVGIDDLYQKSVHFEIIFLGQYNNIGNGRLKLISYIEGFHYIIIV